MADTPEERSAKEAAFALHFVNLMTARGAIMESTRWKRGTAGTIPCPICADGSLHFSVASNGHVHAGCSTPECVRWME